jgi:hypothetical protein
VDVPDNLLFGGHDRACLLWSLLTIRIDSLAISLSMIGWMNFRT